MQTKQVEGGYVVVLDRGEKVIASLIELAKREEIPSATLSGLGVIKNAKLGFYHLDRKKYEEKELPAESELVNLTGNISWFQGQPVIHCHVTLGDPEFRLFGGHMFEGEVGVTVEIFVATRSYRIERQHNPQVGLNLQKLT